MPLAISPPPRSNSTVSTRQGAHVGNCCIAVGQVAIHESIYALMHVISWPYLDVVSALTVGGHLLSLVRRCLTLCRMIYEILQSAQQPLDNH